MYDPGDVTSFCLRTHMVIFANGTAAKFDKIFDKHGEETTNAYEGVTATVQRPDGRWGIVAFSDFQRVYEH